MPTSSSTSLPLPRRTRQRILGLSTALALSIAAPGCKLSPGQLLLLIEDIIKSLMGQEDQARRFTMSDPAASLPANVPGINARDRRPIDQGPGDGPPSNRPRVGPNANFAPIFQDHLYLSVPDRGLHVMDLKGPQPMRLAGRFKNPGSVVDMELAPNHLVLALADVLVDNPEKLPDPEAEQPVVSELVLLDPQAPTRLEPASRWYLPGMVVDSTLVDNRLYVTSYQYEGCWTCDPEPNLRITSYDVSDRSAPRQLDELVVPKSETPTTIASVLPTDDRLYVAWHERGRAEDDISPLYVIDISDDAGEIRLASEINIHGAVLEHSHMNERDGVLRVLSHQGWGLENVRLQAYAVNDPSSPELLSETTLEEPEEGWLLGGVHIDQDRGYLLPFSSSDTLITLDLSDPSSSSPTGLIQIDGEIDFIKANKEELVVFGTHRNDSQGQLNATLFNVQDLEDPRQVRRIDFGLPWDDHRLSFTTAPWSDQDLLAIPFSGQEKDPSQEPPSCGKGAYTYQIALFDWKDQDLRLRGHASTDKWARQLRSYEDQLIAIDHLAAHDYDITQRDEPKLRAKEPLALNIQSLHRLSAADTDASQDRWLRIGETGNRGMTLDVVAKDEQDRPLSPDALVIHDHELVGCSGIAAPLGVYPVGQYVHLAVVTSNFTTDQNQFEILTLDLSQGQPRLMQTSKFKMDKSFYGLENHTRIDGMLVTGFRIMQKDDRLFWVNEKDKEDENDTNAPDSEIVVLDLSGPNVREITRLGRPTSRYTGALTSMNDRMVSSWYAEPANQDDPSLLRVHWQRLEVDDAGDVHIQDMQVPGIPLALSPEGTALSTVDFEITRTDTPSLDACKRTPNARTFDPKNRRCISLERHFHRSMLMDAGPLVLDTQPFSRSWGDAPDLHVRNEYLLIKTGRVRSSLFPDLSQVDPRVQVLEDDSSVVSHELTIDGPALVYGEFFDGDHVMLRAGAFHPHTVFQLRGTQAPQKRAYRQDTYAHIYAPAYLDGDQLICVDTGESVERLMPHSR